MGAKINEFKARAILEDYKNGIKVEDIVKKHFIAKATLYALIKEGIKRGEITIRKKNISYVKIDYDKLEKMLKEGYRATEIAKELDVHLSTVYDCIKRKQLTLPTMLHPVMKKRTGVKSKTKKEIVKAEDDFIATVMKIKELEEQGYSRKVIGKKLGIGESTVSRKISAYNRGEYANKGSKM